MRVVKHDAPSFRAAAGAPPILSRRLRRPRPHAHLGRIAACGGRCYASIVTRIACLDFGDRRIGVAVSDELGWTAQAVDVVSRTRLEADLEALRACLAPYAPSAIVIGLPKNMNGTLGPQAQKALAFARDVEAALGIPTIMWDERLSTVGAERVLLEADLSRRKRRKVIDKVAAVFILQGYLDSLERAGGVQ